MLEAGPIRPPEREEGARGTEKVVSFFLFISMTPH